VSKLLQWRLVMRMTMYQEWLGQMKLWWCELRNRNLKQPSTTPAPSRKRRSWSMQQ
jgi:hypothetical protein